MDTKKIELLAPAGSWEALLAAINNGADAVYLGGKAFGARHYAANFGDEELKRAVEYAHGRDVKIYVTVNTLVSNAEMEEAAHYLNFLYQLGVDAVIVQDVGIVKLISELFPDFEVHASTQMTIHNAAGVELLKSYGLSRVVVARELTLEDIKSIAQQTDLELEMFIHGALCICYSGQCLMSSMIGGRSGNRGKCAQPCRMKYKLVDQWGQEIDYGNKGEHLLSPRDLNTLLYLPQIVQSGVTSLKLEGRMKRPEYVATVIRIYRRCLDRSLADPENYEVHDEELRDLAQIFNRDFTSGYLFGNPGADLMSYKRPNNRGLFLGRITKINLQKNRITLKLSEPLAVNDGIEVWVSKGGQQGFQVTKMWFKEREIKEAVSGQEISIEIYGKKLRAIKVGDRVFKTHDEALISQALKSIKAGAEKRKIPIKARVQAREGEPLVLTVMDWEGNMATAQTTFRAQKAIKRPLTPETVRQQLERLGNTPFYLKELECQLQGELMVPFSELNEVRREAVDKLEKARQPVFSRVMVTQQDIINYLKQYENNHQLKIREHELAVAVGDVASGLAALEAGAHRIYLPMSPWRGRNTENGAIEKLLAACQKNHCELIIALPRLWPEREKSKIEKILAKGEKLGVSGYLIGNLGTLQLLQDLRINKNIYADFPLNIFNSLGIGFFANYPQIKGVTLSPELNWEQIMDLSPWPNLDLECIIHGSIPLMLSEHCVVGAVIGGRKTDKACSRPCLKGKYGLKDRLNFIFPLEMDENCRMHVFNSKELCLIEDLVRFREAGVKALRIEGRRYTPAEIRTITSTYRKALTALDAGFLELEKLAEWKEKLAQGQWGTFTKGHYYRGVL